MKRIMNADTKKLILIGIAIGVTAIVGFNAVQASTLASKLRQEEQRVVEEQRPADLAITILYSNFCTECSNPNIILDQLKEQDINVTSERRIEIVSDEGRSIVDEYDVKFVPAVIVEGEIAKSSVVEEFLGNFGNITADSESEGMMNFVQTSVMPPYYDLTAGEVKGLFSVIYISDAECEECYDVKNNASALWNIGLATTKNTYLDVSDVEGRELIERYAITAAPLIILNGDLDVYSTLQAVWSNVGTVEDDGSYVLRRPEAFGTYRDLETGDVITSDDSQGGGS